MENGEFRIESLEFRIENGDGYENQGKEDINALIRGRDQYD